jgi:hypothetical protein
MNLNLFQNTDAENLSLKKYVDTFLNSSDADYNIFQLPPIQRNAVWNVAQIERLWDSILRGFPIGSLLLANRKTGSTARNLIDGNQHTSEEEGFFLLDGQQRTRSILLGFAPTTSARLWIDLDPILNFGNPEMNDRKFMLRVLTSYQPWGMNDRNPTDKISEAQKFDARNELNNVNVHYDYQVSINLKQNSDQSEIFSWPVRSNLPVPIDLLLKLFIGSNDEFKVPEWKEVSNLISSRYEKPENAPQHFFEIVEALRPILNTEDITIRKRSIVLLYQNEILAPTQNFEQDSMEVLFRRVNAGGTVLQGEEMTYSLLKSSWDGAYDMVSSIVTDSQIGYLLSPTRIVMAATRLSRYIQNNTDTANPNISSFRKWIGETEVTPLFLITIQELLIKGKGKSRSIFHNVVHLFCELVLYKDNLPSDIGLPRKLLLSMNPNLYHPVLIWIYEHRENKKMLENNRINILRFLIHCHLTVDKYEKASKKVIDYLRENKGDRFPDKEIYDLLVNEGLATMLPTIEEFSRPFAGKTDGLLRTHDELFNIEGDGNNLFRQWFWHDSRTILLWFQREYAAKWFEGYNPSSDDNYDTPYDWDHILPYSHIIGNGNFIPPSDIKEEWDKFWHSRYRYINSIGNLRIWPFWANRSDGNNCHTIKLRMSTADFKEDIIASELLLKSSDEFFEASSIDKDDSLLWQNAGGTPRDWNKTRSISWQLAVEKRVCYLYGRLYKSFKFEDWITKKEERDKQEI